MKQIMESQATERLLSHEVTELDGIINELCRLRLNVYLARNKKNQTRVIRAKRRILILEKRKEAILKGRTI